MIKKTGSLLAFLILMFSQDPCLSKQDTNTKETKKGISIVHNQKPVWGKNPEVELEFIRSIGVEESENENYQLFYVSDVVKDKKDNYYILDLGNNRIQKYGPDGRYISTIGRKGQGPGDFLVPRCVVINKGDLVVLNSGNMRIDRFSFDGIYKKSFKLERFLLSFLPLENGKIAGNSEGKTNYHTGEICSKFIMIFNKSGDIVSSFGDVKDLTRPFVIGVTNLVSMSIDKKNKFLYLAYGIENKLEKYDYEGNLLLRFDRKLPYDIYARMGHKVTKTDAGNSKIPFPEWSQVSASASVDNKGRLWVATFFEQPELPDDFHKLEGAIYPESTHLEIYDINGIWLGKINTPGNLHFLKIQGESAFFTDKNMISMHEYRIVEK